MNESMKDALKNLYQHGKITKEKVKSYVPKFITPDDYTEITGEPYVA